MKRQTMGLLIASILLTSPILHAEEWKAVSFNRTAIRFFADGRAAFDLDLAVHGGPKFSNPRMNGMPEVRDGVRVYTDKIEFMVGPRGKKTVAATAGLSVKSRQSGPDSVEIELENKGATLKPPVSLGLSWNPREWLGGAGRATDAAGKTIQFGLPTPTEADGNVGAIAAGAGIADNSGIETHPNIARVEIQPVQGKPVQMTFDPPVNLTSSPVSLEVAWTGATGKVTVTAPGKLAFQAENPWVDTTKWFEAKCANDPSQQSLLGLDDWQEAPAGKHGFVLAKGDRLEFEDGTPVKFWGVVFCRHDLTEETVDKHVPLMAQYGINLARMCTFAKPAGGWSHYVRIQDTTDGLKFDKDAMHIFDYAFAKLKERGIYAGFCPFYGWEPTEIDKTRIKAFDEVMAIRTTGLFAKTFYALTCIAPDVQNLQIQFDVNLLNHVNPLTGKRYADDPAVAYFELQNEENGFLGLFQMSKVIDKAPTYKRLIQEKFTNWLAKRYPDRAALAKAWGADLKPNEDPGKANLNPFPAWYTGQEVTPRIVDQMAFFADLQREYYGRWAKAIRTTGYKGPLHTSNWHGMSWLAHLHNLATDFEIGPIDRHRYGPVNLLRPGTGLMHEVFVEVANRPFSVSEWSGGWKTGMSLDVPFMGIYGMGLEGFDRSMQMAWGYEGVMPYQARNINSTANAFAGLAQYPTMARSVRRFDVQEGDVVGLRRVSVPELNKTGKTGFIEYFSPMMRTMPEAYAVPIDAAVAGRVLYEFTNGPVEQEVVDKTGPWIDRKAKVVRSTTGQLVWDYSKDGFFTVNTPGTKGVVGYTGGPARVLGGVTIQTDNPFANIYVTAMGKTETIANAKRLLVTTVARMVDKGVRFDELSDQPLADVAPKTGPLLVEPVKATIELLGRQSATVYALDHDGCKPANARPLPVEKTKDGLRFTADGNQSKAVYYVVELP